MKVCIAIFAAAIVLVVALYGSVRAMTAPTPTPERIRIQRYVVRNYNALPIHVYSVSFANARDYQYQHKYEQCVAFRNVSTKVANYVEFSFAVESQSRQVQLDFWHSDQRTFTPPIKNEYCWHGMLPYNRDVSLMTREVITVKRVDFADGTTWHYGMPFLRGYEDDGTRLPEPVEQHPETPKPTARAATPSRPHSCTEAALP